MDKWVAVTGACGYIGGQTVLKFKDKGYKVLGVDRAATAPWIRQACDAFVEGDFTNLMFILNVVNNNVEAIIHCAGTSLVGPSVLSPGQYYVNNVGNTAKLLAILKENKWQGTFVFSSSAAVYGNPVEFPLTENSLKVPVSPYGHSKLMTEQAIKDCAFAYNLKAISLRYFNACGADLKGRHGQLKNATHLIARIMESVLNKSVFTLNGTNYDTPDGTCVRDYLHVDDIANAHYLSVQYAQTMETGSSQEFNLGTGTGISINEIIASVERNIPYKVLVHKGPRREGDPAKLVASSSKIVKHMGWKPENSSIDNIVRSAWAWYNSTEFKNRA
jgi:UDP-glucose 4-epimerase